jgi:hypothetical protein
MSKIKLESNPSGTGTFTIQSPASSTDRTLTLPDGAGEILLSDGDGSSLTGVGKVLQVVTNSTTTRTQTASTSYVDATDYTCTITPSSTSSKILIQVDAQLGGSGTNNVKMLVMYTPSGGSGTHIADTETGINRIGGVDYFSCISYLHSPSTTSEIVYQVRIANTSGSGACINQISPMRSFITLWEIAG